MTAKLMQVVEECEAILAATKGYADMFSVLK